MWRCIYLFSQFISSRKLFIRALTLYRRCSLIKPFWIILLRVSIETLHFQKLLLFFVDRFNFFSLVALQLYYYRVYLKYLLFAKLSTMNYVINETPFLGNTIYIYIHARVCVYMYVCVCVCVTFEFEINKQYH